MKEISIKEIEGIKIGNAQDEKGGTGCTVILCPEGAAAGMDVRGGGPASRESELLYTLMLHPENVYTREQLVLKVWGSDAQIEPGNVDNYISFLRKRLREVKSTCSIKTIYGTGFQLEKDHA